MQTELQEAQERVDAWLAEGNIALAEGRVEESMAIADSALEANPRSTEALALKSMCFERMGMVAEALQFAERVVELNPDSELDKIRRNNLRSNLGSFLQLSDKADRKLALIAAVAAGVAVLAVGVAIARTLHSSNVVVAQNGGPAAATPLRPTTPGNVGQQYPNNQLYRQAPGSNPPANGGMNSQLGNPYLQPSAPPANQAGSPDGSQQNIDPEPPLPTYSGPLPDVPQSGVITIKPNSTDSQGTSSGAGSSSGGAQNSNANGVDPAPGPMSSNTANSNQGAATVSPPSAEADSDPGEIEITVHHDRPKHVVGGSDPVSSTDRNEVAALSRTGTQQYLIGSYSAAANSFERALRGGGDPISLNQKLGSTYDRLGRTSDAAGAYQRAIDACKNALTSGKGNKSRIQSVMESCIQAEKVLGG